MSSFNGQPRFTPCKKQMTLDSIMKKCSFFDIDNPATYVYYLKANTNLSEMEIAYYKDLIHFLKGERADELDMIRNVMRLSSDVWADNKPL